MAEQGVDSYVHVSNYRTWRLSIFTLFRNLTFFTQSAYFQTLFGFFPRARPATQPRRQTYATRYSKTKIPYWTEGNQEKVTSIFQSSYSSELKSKIPITSANISKACPSQPSKRRRQCRWFGARLCSYKSIGLPDSSSYSWTIRSKWLHHERSIWTAEKYAFSGWPLLNSSLHKKTSIQHWFGNNIELQ